MGGEREGGQEQQDSGGGAVGRVQRLGFHSHHTISSQSKSSQLWEPPYPCQEMQIIIPIPEAHKMRGGFLANVCDPGHCATLPLQEILWNTQRGELTFFFF